MLREVARNRWTAGDRRGCVSRVGACASVHVWTGGPSSVVCASGLCLHLCVSTPPPSGPGSNPQPAQPPKPPPPVALGPSASLSPLPGPPRVPRPCPGLLCPHTLLSRPVGSVRPYSFCVAVVTQDYKLGGFKQQTDCSPGSDLVRGDVAKRTGRAALLLNVGSALLPPQENGEENWDKPAGEAPLPLQWQNQDEGTSRGALASGLLRENRKLVVPGPQHHVRVTVTSAIRGLSSRETSRSSSI